MNAVKIDVSVVCIAAANHHALNARAEMNCSFACIPFLPTACRRERNTVISVSVDIQFTFRRSINSSGIDKGELIVSRLRNKEVHRNGVSSFTIRINKARSRVSTMIIVRGYIRKNRILRLDSIRQGIVVITDINHIPIFKRRNLNFDILAGIICLHTVCQCIADATCIWGSTINPTYILVLRDIILYSQILLCVGSSGDITPILFPFLCRSKWLSNSSGLVQ